MEDHNRKGDLDNFIWQFIPLKNGKISAPKLIDLICVFLTVYLLNSIYNDFQVIEFRINDHLGLYFLQFTIVPFLYLGTGITFLWLKKTLGWLLVTSYFIVKVVFTIFNFWDSLTFEYSHNPLFDALAPEAPLNYVLYAFLSLCVIYILFRKDVMAVYSTHKYLIYLSLALGFVLFCLISLFLQ